MMPVTIAAGYGGEPAVLLAAGDRPRLSIMGVVMSDLLGRLRATVRYAVSDWAAC